MCTKWKKDLCYFIWPIKGVISKKKIETLCALFSPITLQQILLSRAFWSAESKMTRTTVLWWTKIDSFSSNCHLLLICHGCLVLIWISLPSRYVLFSAHGSSRYSHIISSFIVMALIFAFLHHSVYMRNLFLLHFNYKSGLEIIFLTRWGHIIYRHFSGTPFSE